jgi:hypothetical protein
MIERMKNIFRYLTKSMEMLGRNNPKIQSFPPLNILDLPHILGKNSRATVVVKLRIVFFRKGYSLYH